MAEATETLSIPSLVSDRLKRWAFTLQDYTFLSLQSIANIFTPPQYWGDTLGQMDLIGVGSISIVSIAALFIGAVTVLDTSSQFARFGMAGLTGEAVSIAMVRELGPTITALLVAGRNASGIASELGSMVVTEQIDAMRALGTDPIRKLMTPRVLATLFVLPLLVAIADFLGLVGGYVLSYVTLRVGAVQFWTQAVDSLAIGDIVTGLVKPLVFALLIATIGCYQGLRVRGGTQGVGRATTSAVVISSVAILVVNLFVDRLLLSIFGL